MGKTRMKKGMFIGSIVLAFSLATTTSAFATTDPTKALKTKITQLTNQVNSLKKQVTSLTSKNKSLQSQVTSLTNNNKSLQSQVNSLTSKNNSLQTQVNTITGQKNTLQSQVTTLTNENKKLKALVPTVKAGKIFDNGVATGQSNFVTMGGKSYVEIDSIIPTLTGYTDINYNYDNTNLYLGVKPVNGSISLTKLTPYSYSGDVQWNNWYDDIFKINNKEYLEGLTARVYDGLFGEFTYKIDNKYSKLSFKLGIDDRTEFAYNAKVIIYGDNNPIFTSSNINYLDDAIDYSINVKGYKYIKIKMIGTDYDNSYPVMANPILTP
ncbi:NPCBM/NEW2 domain-containing protein [Gottfriedia sp. NPDC058432]|uniref:NPCBM/NEW2 domain-containing protein n=1 Tax=Gottfriedia sp. NPDC058432 TaxID=3346497 RepID=UPI003657ADEE